MAATRARATKPQLQVTVKPPEKEAPLPLVELQSPPEVIENESESGSESDTLVATGSELVVTSDRSEPADQGWFAGLKRTEPSKPIYWWETSSDKSANEEIAS
jgi:hypothetical protein